MNKDLLEKHLDSYGDWRQRNADRYATDMAERAERKAFYQGWTAGHLAEMTADELTEYISGLWAMQIWGNKRYVADKLIENNGLAEVGRGLGELLWGTDPVPGRWDRFRARIKGVGPAMMSELLCYVHPEQCMVWNRRAWVGLNYLGVEGLPKYDYQMDGARYQRLTGAAEAIGREMAKRGHEDDDLLAVDYFIWEELQVEENLSALGLKTPTGSEDITKADRETSGLIHNEVRDKLSAIGEWLGFAGRTEVKVSAGSVVDATWEATIGNMGRVIYVFEVQAKGGIDSLLMNLLKSLNNPAVQGVVAVSDGPQLEMIQRQAEAVPSLRDKLKYWNYDEVLQVYEKLGSVNEAINALGLVPDGFGK